jgi:O-methyltransferase involved in polyketide biosynthesis
MVGSILHETSPRRESLTKPALLPAQSPAVLIETDDPLVSHPEARERLTAVALDFTTALAQSGLDHASPDYRKLWDEEHIIAETRFRSMYGGQAWMNHHIQSHHAQAEPAAR